MGLYNKINNDNDNVTVAKQTAFCKAGQVRPCQLMTGMEQ